MMLEFDGKNWAENVSGVDSSGRPITLYDWEQGLNTVTRTDLAKHGRCIDHEGGLDCGCLICGRE